MEQSNSSQVPAFHANVSPNGQSKSMGPSDTDKSMQYLAAKKAVSKLCSRYLQQAHNDRRRIQALDLHAAAQDELRLRFGMSSGLKRCREVDTENEESSRPAQRPRLGEAVKISSSEVRELFFKGHSFQPSSSLEPWGVTTSTEILPSIDHILSKVIKTSTLSSAARYAAAHAPTPDADEAFGLAGLSAGRERSESDKILAKFAASRQPSQFPGPRPFCVVNHPNWGRNIDRSAVEAERQAYIDQRLAREYLLAAADYDRAAVGTPIKTLYKQAGPPVEFVPGPALKAYKKKADDLVKRSRAQMKGVTALVKVPKGLHAPRPIRRLKRSQRPHPYAPSRARGTAGRFNANGEWEPLMYNCRRYTDALEQPSGMYFVDAYGAPTVALGQDDVSRMPPGNGNGGELLPTDDLVPDFVRRSPSFKANISTGTPTSGMPSAPSFSPGAPAPMTHSSAPVPVPGPALVSVPVEQVQYIDRAEWFTHFVASQAADEVARLADVAFYAAADAYEAAGQVRFIRHAQADAQYLALRRLRVVEASAEAAPITPESIVAQDVNDIISGAFDSVQQAGDAAEEGMRELTENAGGVFQYEDAEYQADVEEEEEL